MGRRIEIGDYGEIRALSVIRCDGEVKIGGYSVISNFVLAYGSASLIMGKHCYIGPQSLINADEDVKIGNGSALGPRCMVFTHGSFLPYTEGYWSKLAGVTIGDKVWIAAGVFIHPGVEIGDDVFVNSRSVLTQNVSAGVVVEGFPAKPTISMNKLRRKMTPQRVDTAAGQVLTQFGEIILRRKLGIEVRADAENVMRFCYRDREYLATCINSHGPAPALGEINNGKRVILLVNRPNWNPPAALKDPMIFDLTTMRTYPARDKMHAALWDFMRMYFGVTFEYEMSSAPAKNV